ncbi:MAG: DUF4352 domain-containing protein [Actinomycetaceae bacterium]|nr:DUF4352 domain-containing protein [Actinomycetaceae bacterium]
MTTTPFTATERETHAKATGSDVRPISHRRPPTRLFCGLAAVSLSLTIVGCGSSTSEPTATSEAVASSTTPAPQTSSASEASGTTAPTTPETTTFTPTPGSVEIGDYSVEIVGYLPDAGDFLANNEPPANPAEGYRYLGIKIRATNIASPLFETVDPRYDGRSPSSLYGLDNNLEGTVDGKQVTVSTRAHTVGGYSGGDGWYEDVGSLLPGETGEGWAFFEVESNFELTEFQMRESTSSGDWVSVPIPEPDN